MAHTIWSRSRLISSGRHLINAVLDIVLATFVSSSMRQGFPSAVTDMYRPIAVDLILVMLEIV